MVPLLALVCALLLGAGGADAAAAAAQRSESIWQFAASRPDLSTVTYLITQLPDILLRLSDPTLSITMFMPTDNALRQCRYPEPGQQCSVPLRQLLKSNMILTDLLYSGTDVGMSASSNRRYSWQVLMYMGLAAPKALTLSALKNGSSYTTAAAAVAGGANYIDPSALTVLKNSSGTYITSDMEFTAWGRVQQGDFRAGKSIVHLVDADIFPGIPPTDSFYSVYDGIWPLNNFTAVLMAVKDTLDLDHYPMPLTVFGPSDAAMQHWLRTQNSSLDQLLSNTSLCLHLAKVHCVTSNPATWAAFMVPDLVAMAAAQNEKLNSQPLGIKNLNGELMQLKMQYTGLSPGPLSVAFNQSTSSRTPWGQVLPPVDFGGQEVSYGEEGGVVHVYHVVTAVMMR